MKPATTIAALLLLAISIAHLVRIINQIDIVVNGLNVPIWVSVLGCIVPLVLALMLWRENKR